MPTTKTAARAVRGPSADDRENWIAARTQGITATDVRDAAKGTSTDRRRIIAEKIGTRVTPDLAGNRYIDWGHEREPIILDWVARRFGIQPDGCIYAKADQPRYLATPDGYSIDEMTEEVLGVEVKTTKYDLWPFDDGGLGKDGPLALVTPAFAHGQEFRKDKGVRFWQTGYYDQMQWQMFVTGAKRWLFVFEQHDDDWETGPHPIAEPIAVWIAFDKRRVQQLVEVANSLLDEVDAARVGDLPADTGTIPDAIADDVHKVLEYRNAEAIAAEGKKAAWNAVQAYFKGKEGTTFESSEAKVTWGVKDVPAEPDVVVPDDADEKKVAALTRADDAVKKAQERIQRADAALTKAKAALATAEARQERARTPFLVPRVKREERLTITAVRGNKKEA